MANVFQNTDWLSMEYLRMLVNQLEVAPFFNTDYNKEYTQPFAIGATARIPYPERWLVTEGIAYQPQGIDQRTTEVTIDQTPGIHFEYNALEKALQMGRSKDWIRKNLIMPQMKQMANHIDQKCIEYATKRIPNTVGQLGTAPTNLDLYADARAILDENAAPPGERGMIITPRMQNAATKVGVGYFNPTDEISKQYKSGSMGKYSNFEFYSSNNLGSLTAGTRAGAVTVNGAGQSGNSLNINCTNGDTFFEGEPFTIAVVNNVNPISRESTLVLKQCCVAQDLTATSTTATLQIRRDGPSSGIEGPGSKYQNVDSLPANLAALTFWPGTTSPNGKSGKIGLGLTNHAFALVGVPMEQPKAVEESFYMRDPGTGLALLYVRQYDNVTMKMTNRLQTLFGFGDLYPGQAAVRVASLS